MFNRQWFTKIYNRIIQRTSTNLIVTQPPSIVDIEFILIVSRSVIAHVLFPTFLANLHVSISMKFSNLVNWYPRLQMQSIYILTDKIFHFICLNHLGDEHVGWRWESFDGFDSYVLRGVVYVLFKRQVFCRLILPSTWSCIQDSVFSWSVIRDTCWCANTRACKSYTVFRTSYEFSNLIDLLSQNIWRIKTFFFGLVLRKVSHIWSTELALS